MSERLFTLRDIETATKGTIHGAKLWEISISQVIIDSRECWEDCLFVPLKGENTDGHKFISKAIDKGCRVVLVFREWWEENSSKYDHSDKTAFVVVENTLVALQNLARFHIVRFPDLIKIAVTGSSGKTTTKEILGKIFSEAGATLINEGNFNSEIGLPLSVFRLKAGYRYAVFEMGMNHPGEIKDLAAIVHPDFALITNVGTAHIGMMDGQKGIAEEKKMIFSQFDGSQIAVIPGDDSYAPFLTKDIKGQSVLWSKDSLRIVEDLGVKGFLLELDGKQVVFPLVGLHNVENARAAAALAKAAGLSTSQILRGLEKVAPLFGRGEIIEGDVTLIRDCYNANPESMEQSLSFVESLDWAGNKIVVLGDMLELGEDAERLHLAACQPLLEAKTISAAVLYGTQMGSVYKKLKNKISGELFWTDDFLKLKEAVLQFTKAGDLVLLKASRGIALEDLTEILEGIHV